jgi:hypothetical protein
VLAAGQHADELPSYPQRPDERGSDGRAGVRRSHRDVRVTQLHDQRVVVGDRRRYGGVGAGDRAEWAADTADEEHSACGAE